MEKLIESIKENSVISINGKSYNVIAKSLYVTQDNPVDYYAKIFFNDHFALVLSPSDDFIYFGKDIGQIPYEFPTPDTIEYEQEKYKKIAEDYQIVRQLVFGSPVETEGEVKFIDYECVADENKLISVGKIVRNGKRADIVAKVMSLSDICVEEG